MSNEFRLYDLKVGRRLPMSRAAQDALCCAIVGCFCGLLIGVVIGAWLTQ